MEGTNETTWEYKLHKGIKFHDGSDLTADDVIFSYDRAVIIRAVIQARTYTKGKPTLMTTQSTSPRKTLSFDAK